jgi:CPA1 family monovalent cation:H+ antiporter
MISSYLILLIFLSLVFNAVARRLKFPPELFLVVVSGAISFIPFVPRFTIDGYSLLEIILPPLLFSAARNLSAYKFRKMRWPIIYLGFFMTFITALIVAVTISALVGFMTFTSGLILGAVIAPPDAVSAVSIGKKLGLPERVMVILTGESLINDAAALTIFSFAVAESYGNESFIQSPALLFLWTCLVGAFIGIFAGVLAIAVRRILKEPNIIAIFTAIVPFAVYVSCEHVHASGVLGVVTAGFVIEKTTFRSTYSTRLQEKTLWRSIEMLFDSFVFAYIGLQFRFIITDLIDSGLDEIKITVYGFLVLLIAILIRPIGLLGYAATKNIWYRLHLKRLRHFVSLSKNRTTISEFGDTPVTWREYIILSWTGMRGVVTLATASAVPTIAEISHESAEFKTRVFIQVISLIVAVGTLLLQGLTLPFLTKKILNTEKMVTPEQDPLNGEWAKARKLMEAAALRVIDAEYEANPNTFDKERVEMVWRNLDVVTTLKNRKDISFMSKLLLEIVEAQREDIQSAARNREIHPDVAREYLDSIDYKLIGYRMS